ncbi:Lrp/AsnC family transcriptional regulator [Microbacterium sp. NPDC058021]|uniref:Lrp/AsnC family transcriptional regulator n=1 Tax=Microbacterium sp. NPDC058021 TaxID=3346306 RepID=UPI0036DAA05E
MSNMTESRMHSAGRSAVQIDEIGYDILRALRDDGRVSIAALASRVGISRASAYTRVEALTRAGVITGYAARVDPAKAGLGVCALVFCSVHPQNWEEFFAAVRALPEVESAKITTGEHDIMLLVRSIDVEGIHTLVVGGIASLPQVAKVETVLVLNEVFQRPYVLPTDIPGREAVLPEQGLMSFVATSSDRPTG